MLERRKKQYPASLVMEFQKNGDDWEGTGAQPIRDSNGDYFWGTPWYALDNTEPTYSSWFGFGETAQAETSTAERTDGGALFGFFFTQVQTLIRPEIDTSGYEESAAVGFDYSEAPAMPFEYGFDAQQMSDAGLGDYGFSGDFGAGEE